MKKSFSIAILAAILWICTSVTGSPAYAETDFDSWGLTAPPSDDTKNVILDIKTSRSSEITPVDTEFTSADGKKLRLTMTGLTASNTGSMLDALSKDFDGGEHSDTPVKVTDQSFIDAEKWDCLEGEKTEYFFGYDTLHCWAASCSNMLWLSGWAGEIMNPRTGELFKSEDDIFEYYNVNFTDRGSDADRAIDWFFMGEYFLSGNSNGAGVFDKKAGGFKKTFVSSLAQTQYDLVKRPSDIENMLRVAAAPGNRSVFEVSVGSVSESGLSGSQHALTGIGLITDPDTDDIAQKYKAIILIDSDNDGIPAAEERTGWEQISSEFEGDDPFSEKNNEVRARLIKYMEDHKEARPNSYTVYKLRYSADAAGTPYWEVVGYSDNEPTAIYDIDELPCPSNKVIAECFEVKGSRDVNTDVDLTLDNLFTTSGEESLQDPYMDPAADAKKNVFEQGEPVNINYFLANRSNVDLGGESSDGKNVLVDWTVTRDSDGSTVASGSVDQLFNIFAGSESGAMLYLNKTSSGYEKWQPGAYTATVGFNKDGKVREAYYLNNIDKSVHFTVTGEAAPENTDDGSQDSGSPQKNNEPQNENVKEAANTPGNPARTGDEANLALWILTAVLAAAALAVSKLT